MVSHCNKASKSKAIEGVQTDGYFVSAFQGPRKQHDECRNKTANFYLPFEKQLDHGQVVVNFVGALKSNFFNNLSSGLSAFKFYGLPDSGGNLMKEAWWLAFLPANQHLEIELVTLQPGYSPEQARKQQNLDLTTPLMKWYKRTKEVDADVLLISGTWREELWWTQLFWLQSDDRVQAWYNWASINIPQTQSTTMSWSSRREHNSLSPWIWHKKHNNLYPAGRKTGIY